MTQRASCPYLAPSKVARFRAVCRCCGARIPGLVAKHLPGYALYFASHFLRSSPRFFIFLSDYSSIDVAYHFGLRYTRLNDEI